MSRLPHGSHAIGFSAVSDGQGRGFGVAAGLDPNAPLLEISQEVVGLSVDPVDDALFQVPADYQTATLEEVLKGAVSAPALPQFRQ